MRWRRANTRAGVTIGLLALCLVGCNERTLPLEVFLVRHAEKVDSSDDAALSFAGAERAQSLAHVLNAAGIERVYSTDFVRTRDTARPLAVALGLELAIYDHRDLAGLVDVLEASGGRNLVVGHSNTTPAVVELLGGDAGPPIDEATEYDRLYLVSKDATGKVRTFRMQYGAVSVRQP